MEMIQVEFLEDIGELTSIEIKERVQTLKTKGSSTEDDAIKRTEVIDKKIELNKLQLENKVNPEKLTKQDTEKVIL